MLTSSQQLKVEVLIVGSHFELKGSLPDEQWRVLE
jgi:hypothetical protein